MNSPTPLEQLIRSAVSARQMTIGLPASLGDSERRFPLTPEAAGILVERGFSIRMETGAALPIHYGDTAYAMRGVDIVSRAEALRSDIVIHLPAISEVDARRLKRGALLLGFAHIDRQAPRALAVLLQKSVTAMALDRVRDESGKLPFADILREIDGRAAIAIASALLADAVHGKGMLLGGVAGIVPCEVTIIGADIAAVAAARSVLGLGATVRIFDNDVYRLREATGCLGQGVIGSAIHPKVLASALRSADVVIGCSSRRSLQIGADIVGEMKRGVITFDLAHGEEPLFPSMPTVDLALASPCDNAVDGETRVCYINAGNAVPRTAAMALSNTLLTLFDDMAGCDSAVNALKLIPGLRRAAYAFLGKPVSADVARIVGMRAVDINLLLQFS